MVVASWTLDEASCAARRPRLGPAGLGPASTDRDRARLDLEDEAAVGAGVDHGAAGPARTSGRPPPGRRRRARSAACRTGRSARRVRQNGRPGGKIGCPSASISATLRALDERRPSPAACGPGRRAIPSGSNVISGPTTPRKMKIGSRPMSAPQSGMTNSDVICEDLVPELLSAVGRASRPKSYPTGPVMAGRAWDCPSSWSRRAPASSRPASSVARPSGRFAESRRRSPANCAAARRFPTDGDASARRSSRPSSHPLPAVRAPRSPERRAERMVVGDDEPRGDRRGADRLRALVDERAQQLVRACAGRRSGRSARPRSARRACPRSGRPSKTSSIPIGAGIAPRSRPMSAAGGAAPGRARARGAGSCHRRAAVGAGQRVAREVGHGESYAAPDRAATIGRVSLLLLVDLDGVVYRGPDPVPGVAAVLADRAARGDDVVYVTNNSMHYRADYVTRLAAMGAPVTPDAVVSSARATALHVARPRAGHPPRAGPGRRRARARAARRRPRRRDRRPGRDADAPGGHRWLGRGRRARTPSSPASTRT